LTVGVSDSSDREWVAWHRAYDNPMSHLPHRLAIVQARIREALERHEGPVRVISMCAGQGHDLLGVLDDHPRRLDVAARLVELDEQNAAIALASIAAAELSSVEVVVADAGIAGSYDGAVPADLVLACGVFGNITDDDIANTIRSFPQLCAAGATVIWTRHRLEPDLTPRIRSWFSEADFEELSFDAPADSFFSVGADRFWGPPQPLEPSTLLFTFIGYTALRG
jgi:hypothetical protein